MTRLYRQDPTLPDSPEERRDEQRLREMWTEFRDLIIAGFDMNDDDFQDAKYALLNKAAESLESRDPYEMAELYFNDVMATVGDPASRIKLIEENIND